MAIRVNKTQGSYKAKTIYIGIDMHKLSWRITAMADNEVVMACTLSRPTYKAFKNMLHKFNGSTIRVAYEAGPGGFELYDQLTGDGIECIVTPPSLIPTESGNRVKTDKKDSVKLARLLQSQMLKKVWVLTPEQRSHRQLVRTRRQIVNHRSDVMRQIKSLLLFHGIQTPFASKQHWSTAFIKWLKELVMEQSALTISLQSLVALFEYLDGEKKRLTEQINTLAMTQTYASRVKLLKSVPGIGTLSAMEILVEIVDINRFHTADQLASFLGVTPSQYSSGERIRMGHITHTGNARLRTTLVESSWLLIGKDLAMRYKYERIKYRRGGKRAIVAIARTLSARIRRMLLDQVLYKTELCKAA
jgi:transposase